MAGPIKKLASPVVHAASGLMIVVLAIGSLVYFVNGSSNALGPHSEDLRLRWNENSKFVSHLNPNAGQQPGSDAAVYPPWSYVLGFPLAPPLDFRMVKYWYWIVECLCLIVICSWAYKTIPTASIRLRWLAALSCAAICGNLNAISLGQYSIIPTAFLAGALLSLERGRNTTPGLLLGLSFLKPQIPILHVAGLVFRNARRFWRPFALAAGIVISASLIAWWWTRTDPFTMLAQAADTASRWRRSHVHSLYFASFALPMKPLLRSIILAAVALRASITASLRMRKGSLVDQFAVCSVFSMLLLDHSPYDNIMLAFLVIALMGRALETKSPTPLILYLLSGITLWLPVPPHVNLGGIEYLIWTLGAFYLIVVPSASSRYSHV